MRKCGMLTQTMPLTNGQCVPSINDQVFYFKEKKVIILLLANFSHQPMLVVFRSPKVLQLSRNYLFDLIFGLGLQCSISSFLRVFVFRQGEAKVLYIDLRPGQTCHSKDRRSDTFRWQLWKEIALAGLADNMGRGKNQWYSHRLMHRKRVTCELHDSYFRLMTIKHAIPKILSGRLNYYITRWRQEVSEFGDQTRWCQDVVEKAPTQQDWPPAEQPWRMRKTQHWWP